MLKMHAGASMLTLLQLANMYGNKVISSTHILSGQLLIHLVNPSAVSTNN